MPTSLKQQSKSNNSCSGSQWGMEKKKRWLNKKRICIMGITLNKFFKTTAKLSKYKLKN